MESRSLEAEVGGARALTGPHVPGGEKLRPREVERKARAYLETGTTVITGLLGVSFGDLEEEAKVEEDSCEEGIAKVVEPRHHLQIEGSDRSVLKGIALGAPLVANADMAAGKEAEVGREGLGSHQEK